MPKYVKGEVNLSKINLMQLPDFLSDVKIQGDFICSVNHLSNLVNAPPEVEGDFDCTENKLKSLEGAPERVLGNFYCYNSSLRTLDGAPKEVVGDFNCFINKLTTLEGAPRVVEGNFNCSNNAGRFTEKEIRAVCEVEGSIYLEDLDKRR